MSEPAPRPDVRVGSSTNGLAPVSYAERSLAAAPRHWLALTLVATAAVVADQATKQLVAARLELGEAVHVIGPLSIHHVQNRGIAFGFFAGATAFVIVLTAAIVSWLVLFFARSGARHPVLPVALGLVLGGSLANLLDRLRLGHVTDFLDVRFWPAFNLADTFIVSGVVALLLTVLRGGDATRPRATRDAPAART